MIAADSPMLTYEEAAIKLGCRATTHVARTTFIAKLVKKKKLKAFIMSRTFKRIRQMELLRYIADNETELRVKR